MIDLPFCKCGCGQRVIKEGNQFIKGHSNKGKQLAPLSEEHKKKIGEAVSGPKNGFYRKEHSEETKKLMKKKWEERKQCLCYEEKQKIRGNKQANTMRRLWSDGTYNSPEYRKSLSDGVKAVWGDPDSVYNTKEHRNKISKNTKRQFQDEEFLKKYQEKMQAKPNNAEKVIIKLLSDMNCSYKFVGDHSLWIDGKNPDFINQEKEKIIELFGDYWHSRKVTGRGKTEEEQVRISHFKEHGYEVLIVWEKELKDLNNVEWKIRRFHNGVG